MSAATWPNLPSRVHSRFITIDDLEVHILEAHPEPTPATGKPPLLLLLHGFPELAYSWRKVILPLADAGYHVVAPDQRGFGQTRRPITTADHERYAYDDDLSPFRMLRLAADIVALVYALGYTSVAAVIGHDFGSPVAAHCALIRPDLFKSVVMMSFPFPGPPALRNDEAPPLSSTRALIREQKLPASPFTLTIKEELAALNPPRLHYAIYYSTRDANAHMEHPPQGLGPFFRSYYYVKSALWDGNDSANPLPGIAPSSASLALLPTYYIMHLGATMPEQVPPDGEVPDMPWLTDGELEVYLAAYGKTGFQGGLNWYRGALDPLAASELRVFAGKVIEIPAMFMSGKSDWGTWQSPGSVDRMRETFVGMKENFVLVPGAGHWVQQEQPEAVVENLLRFLRRH